MKIRRRTVTIISFLIAVLTCTGCGHKNTDTANGTDKKAEYTLIITSPSDDNLPMNLQRDFYVSGDIVSDEPVPDDATVTVKMYDESGSEVRSVSSVCKGNGNLWAFHENMYFSQEDDPERDAVTNNIDPVYNVLDINDPEASFTDAGIKCTFDDDQFRSLIVYATDEAHGLVQDNEVSFVNHDGSPIEGLPEGKYSLKVALTDHEGNTLAETEKNIELKNPENSVLGRFHPDENYQKLLEMSESMGLAGNIDWIPGYVPTDNGDTNGFRAMFGNNDIAIYANSKTHALIYYIEPASSSYRLELAYLQYAGRIGNPDTFKAYHYDCGEPVVRFNNDENEPIEGEIVPFAEGDYMDLCRVDIVDADTPDNIYALDGIYTRKSYTDLTKTVEIEEGERFAVSGVLCPFQLDPEDVVKTDDGLYETDNGYCKLVYEINDGENTLFETKSPTVTRYQSKLTATAVICNYEFYNVFSAADFGEKGKTYDITIRAYDYHMNEIEGASESFSVHIK